MNASTSSQHSSQPLSMDLATTPGPSHRARSSIASQSRVDCEAQPWTTTRCHRLLRPLQSRIAAIRRDSATTGDLAAATIKHHPVSAISETNGQHDWLLPRRKRYRTYAQRRPQEGSHGQGELTLQVPVTLRTLREVEREGARQGQIHPSTPLLRRARGLILSPPVLPQSTNSDSTCDAIHDNTEKPRRRSRRKQTEINERLAGLRGQCTASRYADFESIYRSFEALLIATSGKTEGRRGARSLLDICLRTVPEYIAGVEAWELYEAKQSGGNLSAESIATPTRIYGELESLGASTGWKHLRVVARADGIRALTIAAEEGLWVDDFTYILADLCVQFGAFVEAENLLAAVSNRLLLPAAPVKVSVTERQNLLPHISLIRFTSQTGRKSFVLKQYRQLVTHENFSMDWLMTDDFSHVWEIVIGALSKKSAANEAVDLLVELLVSIGQHLPRGITLRPEKRSGTHTTTAQHCAIIGALATLASMSFLGEYELGESSANHDRIICIRGRLRYILRCCISSFKQRRKHLSHLGYSLSCLALICSSGILVDLDVESGLKQSVDGLWSERTQSHTGWVPRWREHFDILVSLVSSFAINCSRGTAEPPQHFLDICVGRLQNLGLDNEVVNAFKTAAAFHLAQQTNSVRDLIYAENLHRPGASRGDHDDALITPVKAASHILFSGYTWDETIGEWVTASPVATNTVSRRVPRLRHPQSEESDDALSVDTSGMTPTTTARDRRSFEVNTPLTLRPASEARFIATPRSSKRQDCARNNSRSRSSSSSKTQLSLPGAFTFGARQMVPNDTTRRDMLPDWESEEEVEDSVGDVAEWLKDDELAHDKENIDHTPPRAKRRRTHSGLFTARESRSRRRDSSSSRLMISRAFVDDSSSDDELGI